MNLSELAITILRLEKKSISKVRFAKTIYFVHKELIRLGKATSKDIYYIRMPLGPVPDGFMKLELMNPVIQVVKEFTGLAYNTSQYSLQKKLFKRVGDTSLDADIKAILERLEPFTTSELVELSHLDESWKQNVNGITYAITPEDLKHKLPSRKKLRNLSNEADDQLLQASLVKGMIADIVSESTDLEHPADDKQDTTGDI